MRLLVVKIFLHACGDYGRPYVFMSSFQLELRRGGVLGEKTEAVRWEGAFYWKV